MIQNTNQSRPDPEAPIFPIQVPSPEGRGHNNANGFFKMLTHLGGDLDDRCPRVKFLFCKGSKLGQLYKQ